MPVITQASADSKPFVRTFRKHGATQTTFKGCMGVCLTLQERDELVGAYNGGVDAVFSKIGVEREGVVLVA